MSRKNPNVRNSRDIRYVSIEPGRISLHGIALTDGEYAVLHGIAERMKRPEMSAVPNRTTAANDLGNVCHADLL